MGDKGLEAIDVSPCGQRDFCQLLELGAAESAALSRELQELVHRWGDLAQELKDEILRLAGIWGGVGSNYSDPSDSES